MIFISATRLRVKSVAYLVPFILANEASVKQLKNTVGFLGGKELIDKSLTFWTLTLWENEMTMRSFRNSSSHRNAMHKLPKWCDEASYVHWFQNEMTIPDWNFVYKKMIDEGKITKVRYPSPNQLSKNYPEIKWKKLERTFKTPQ